jgi:hypothetical protein
MLDLDALLSAIRAAPDLTGARCTGRSQLFDEQPKTPKGERNEARAIRCCRHCPALRDCAAWLATLPPGQRPPGVVAGKISAPPKRERHKPSQVPPMSMRQKALAAIADHEAALPRAGAHNAAAGRSRSPA